jgi:GT2 family glycosyltransferase
MQSSRVSIIMPCYRQAKYLPAAIQCVRAQSYTNIELVVVNDGSDDNTDEIVARSGNDIVYVHQSNAGLAAARNAGIAASSGNFFLFFDADDLIHPDAVAWHMQAMAGQQDRFSVMSYRIFQSNPSEGEDTLLKSGEPALPRLFRFNLAPPIAYCCSRKMIETVGDFELAREWYCEDWDFWLRIALRGFQMVTVEKLGAFYRRYAGQMSSNADRMERSRIHVLGRAIARIKGDAELRRRWATELQSLQRDQAKMTFDLGYQTAKSGSATKAISLYKQAMKRGYPSLACAGGMAKAIAHAAMARLPSARSLKHPVVAD